MKLRRPCGICTEISKESVLRRETFRDKRNIKDSMSMEGSRNNRRRGISRPHTLAFDNTKERVV